MRYISSLLKEYGLTAQFICYELHKSYEINITIPPKISPSPLAIDKPHNVCYNERMIATHVEQQKLIDFFHTGQMIKLGKNEYVVAPDEAPRGVFYIESGLVKSYDITKYGEENLLIVRKEGELIGLTWAITGQAKSIINAALCPTVVWRMPRERFIEFIRSNPDVAIPIIDTLTNMYRLHSDRIMTLEYRTVKERLASFLLTTAARFGEKTSKGTLINSPLKQQDIASSISATRETTSRSLAALQSNGIIRIEQSLITILDEDALNNIVS